jgi:hypothetical protein
MNGKIICVSKHESRWHEHLINRFKDGKITIKFIYLNKLVEKYGFTVRFSKYLTEIVREINRSGCNHVLYDLEFSSIIGGQDLQYISKFTNTESIGLGLDDDRLHEVNKIVYSYADKMFTTPLSVERYRMLGFCAYNFLPLEVADYCEIKKESGLKKIDKPYVLVYGLQEKSDRKEMVEKIINKGINVKVVPSGVSYKKLYSEIILAPIVLNFSKGGRVVSNPLRLVPFYPAQRTNITKNQYIYQPKGRVYEVGFCGSLCVSEYYPMHEIISKPSLMPIFSNDDEMLLIIEELVKNPKILKKKRRQFSTYIQNKYNSKSAGEEIKKALLEATSLHSYIKTSFLFDVAKSASRCLIYKNPLLLFRVVEKSTFYKKVVASIFVFLTSCFVVLVSLVCYKKNLIKEC